MRITKTSWLMLSMLLLVSSGAAVVGLSVASGPAAAAPPDPAAAGEYVVLAWNDLGMHCYNPSFQDLGVLPPWNTLWAQVARVGDPPEVVTTGVTVTFAFPENTYSVGKSDFWDTSPYRPVQNALWLFGPLLGFSNPLPDDIGLTGLGLSGTMTVEEDYFIAEGIPLTEYRDGNHTQRYPYQLATVIAYEAGTGRELARTTTVAPVSTEMHCEYCHSDNGEGNEDIATGVVEQNILTKHDEENMDEYPAGHQGPLMDRRPVLCAECHATNALGAPGVGGIPSLSNAIHGKHAEEEEMPPGMEGCYSCHPGPDTKCLRGVMSTQYGLDCVSCHGSLATVAQNPNPWFNEPRCDSSGCHGSAYEQDHPLYRFSKEHGGIYCEGCHDSPHAIAPSNQPNDAIKFVGWQGHGGPLDTCTVCHASQPVGQGPHGLAPREHFFIYLPLVLRGS